MSEAQKNMVEYMVACIAEFARYKSMQQKEAFNYLDTYKGLEFLENNYVVEHTFSIDDTIDHLNIICKKMEALINETLSWFISYKKGCFLS